MWQKTESNRQTSQALSLADFEELNAANNHVSLEAESLPVKPQMRTQG
jgi:hypothetical protein